MIAKSLHLVFCHGRSHTLRTDKALACVNRLSGRGKSKEKERAKKTKGANEPLADLFLRFFLTAEPVHRLTRRVVSAEGVTF